MSLILLVRLWLLGTHLKKKSVSNCNFLKIYCSFFLSAENRDREVEKYKMVENSDLNLKCDFWVFLVAQMVKNLPARQETLVQSVVWEAPLQKGMATHSSILAWRIPWTEEPGGLQSRVRHD